MTTMLPKGYCVLAWLGLKYYAPSRAITLNKMKSNCNFTPNYLATHLVRIVKTLSLPNLVIWKAWNRLSNQLRHNLTIQAMWHICFERLTWRPTIALMTYNWHITSRLTPQRFLGTYCLCPMSINQIHQAKVEIVVSNQAVPKLFCSTRDWLETPLHSILAIICRTCQS